VVSVRRAFIVIAGFSASTYAVFACARVAELDVAYELPDGGRGGDGAATDSGAGDRQRVRDSEVVPPDVTSPPPPPPTNLSPCDGGLGTAAGCDDLEGLGCCLMPTGSKCMELREVATSCSGNVFIACLQGNGDNACCWRPLGTGRMAAYAGDCDGGTVACLDSTGCPDDETCRTTTCGTGANSFKIGQCGDAPPACP
jgi:hypothetical protein